jgi:inosose dehydratase
MQKTPSPIQLAIAPVNLTHNEQTSHNNDAFRGAMADISKAQFHGFELSKDFPQDPMLLHTNIRTAGLQVTGSQFRSSFTSEETFSNSIHRFTDQMHFLNAINASVVIVCETGKSTFDTDTPMLGNSPSWNAREWKLLAEGLKRICSLAQQNNMTVVYQPHIGSGIQSEADIDKLMTVTKEDNLSLMIDTGHFKALGISPQKVIKAHPDRVKYVYVSDINQRVLTKAKREEQSYQEAVTAGLFTFPGTGSISFDPIFAALKKADFKGWIVLHGEHEAKKSSFAVKAKAFRKYLKSILGV